jgi:hypothetical protein
MGAGLQAGLPIRRSLLPGVHIQHRQAPDRRHSATPVLTVARSKTATR